MKKIISLFKKPVFIAALVILAVILFIWKPWVKKAKTQIQTQKVERGTIISSISVSGQILTSNIISVTTNAGGLVKNVYVKEGDKVKSGQKILEIELDAGSKQKATSAYSSYLSAKNSLDSASATLYSLDSQMWAANQKFINDAVSRGLLVYDPTYIQQHDDWLAAEAKYINQKSTIAQVQVALNSAWQSYQLLAPTVPAPISGTISSLTFFPGMTISGSSDTTASNQRIAVIKSAGNPLASFNISEIDVSRVKAGQRATIKLDSIAGKTFTGKVMGIDRIGAVTSGVTNYSAIIQLDNEAAEILPNMAATANIILDTKDNVLLVPSSAIQTQNEDNIVRVVKNKKQETVMVETGLVSDTQTEIVFGLSEGDEIVTSTTTTNGNSSQTRSGSVFGGGFGGANRMIIGR